YFQAVDDIGKSIRPDFRALAGNIAVHAKRATHRHLQTQLTAHLLQGYPIDQVAVFHSDFDDIVSHVFCFMQYIERCRRKRRNPNKRTNSYMHHLKPTLFIKPTLIYSKLGISTRAPPFMADSWAQMPAQV